MDVIKTDDYRNQLIDQAIAEGWVLKDKDRKGYPAAEYVERFGRDTDTWFACYDYRSANKKNPTAAKPVVSKQFVPVLFDLLNSRAFRVEHRDKTTLLLYMIQNSVRAKMKSDQFGLYERFFKNGEIVCWMSVGKLADAFGYKSKKSVKDMLKELETEGLIVKHQVKNPYPKKKQVDYQNFYVVGNRKDGKTFYFTGKYGH